MTTRIRTPLAVRVVMLFVLPSACVPVRGPAASSASSRLVDAGPPAPPAAWLPLIGEYGPDHDVHLVLERDGRLIVRSARGERVLSDSATSPRALFISDDGGRVLSFTAGGAALNRRQVGPEAGNQLLLTPNRPIEELRREALATSPPNESGTFRPSDLVELTTLDPTIKLEIRYATSNNLFGTPFYSEGRAFLQRPAAQALVRASAALRRRGYGLLVHDGYRPWSVTKMFWDAAPADKRNFVANPAQGSKHNRGAAVDLTLYELATGRTVEMPGTYDETTARSAPNYPGGTSRQRWHRDLLRVAMEAERFIVNEDEWWHFDFAEWRLYAIGNVDFAKIR